MKRFFGCAIWVSCALLSGCGNPPLAAPEPDAHTREESGMSTVIDADVARTSGIRVAAATAGTIADEHVIQGLLTPVEGRVAEVVARFPGPVRTLRVGVGDTVQAGEVVASVDSNLSLSTYRVRAPMSGVVTARPVAVGAMAGEGVVLLELADLSTLWVDLHLFGADAGHVVPGAPVRVTRLADGKTVRTRLERVLPGMASASQSTIARARIDNTDGRWRPGAAVTARVTVAQQPVALAVPLTALQTVQGREVVFVREGDVYQARPVETGSRDARQVEIVGGIEPGEAVVVAESYLIKADILKTGAAHAH